MGPIPQLVLCITNSMHLFPILKERCRDACHHPPRLRFDKTLVQSYLVLFIINDFKSKVNTSPVDGYWEEAREPCSPVEGEWEVRTAVPCFKSHANNVKASFSNSSTLKLFSWLTNPTWWEWDEGHHQLYLDGPVFCWGPSGPREELREQKSMPGASRVRDRKPAFRDKRLNHPN